MQPPADITAPLRSLLLLLSLTAWTAVQAGGIPLFSAEYEVATGGLTVARLERSHRLREDGIHELHSSTRAVGLARLFRRDVVEERSLWRMEQGHILPLEYRYQRKGGKKDKQVSIRFLDGGRRLEGIKNGRSWSLEAPAGVLDEQLYQLAVMQRLEGGLEVVEFVIVDDDRLKHYRFERIGEERLETPLGPLQTIKLRRDGKKGKRQTIIWCAPALDNLVVQVEHTDKRGRVTTARLRSLEGITPRRLAASR